MARETKEERERRISAMMKFLKCSREEAIKEIEEDDEIDKMSMAEINAEMTKEQKETLRAMTKCGTRKVEKKATPKNVKTSDEKKELFELIKGCLTEEFGENAKVEKENKLIIVQIAQKVFKIDLIEQRPPKK